AKALFDHTSDLCSGGFQGFCYLLNGLLRQILHLLGEPARLLTGINLRMMSESFRPSDRFPATSFSPCFLHDGCSAPIHWLSPCCNPCGTDRGLEPAAAGRRNPISRLLPWPPLNPGTRLRGPAGAPVTKSSRGGRLGGAGSTESGCRRRAGLKRL